MKVRRNCLLFFLMFALLMVGGAIIWVQQQRQETQARTMYYATILARAPCIENVCPGFDEGRTRALERLAASQIMQAKEQGTHLIGLLLIDGKEEIVGDGVVDFTIDDQGNPTIVHNISFGFDDLKLEFVLNTLGEPDQFLFISGCGMRLRVYAELYYLEQGIKVLIDYPTRRPAAQMLAGNTPIQAVVYFQPGDSQNQMVESAEGLVSPYSVAYDFHPSVTADDVLGQIRPWPGLEAAPTPSADFCPR